MAAALAGNVREPQIARESPTGSAATRGASSEDLARLEELSRGSVPQNLLPHGNANRKRHDIPSASPARGDVYHP